LVLINHQSGVKLIFYNEITKGNRVLNQRFGKHNGN